MSKHLEPQETGSGAAERVPPDLLAPAVEAARTALRRLDRRDVPAPLRRVASHSGGELPPPLRTSLLRALDENEWLRAESLDAWPAADPTAPGAAGASALFLQRPPHWQLDVGRLAAEHDRAGQEEALRRLERELEAAQGEAAETRRRLDDVRAETELQRSRFAAETARLRSRAQESRPPAEPGDDARLRAAEAARSAAAADAAAAAREVGRLREQLRTVRRERAALLRRLEAGAGRGGWSGDDAVVLARHLDQLEGSVRPQPPTADTGPGSVPPNPMSLPAGISPDQAAAVTWLLDQHPLTLIVDGYNLAFRLDPDAAPERARLRLEGELAALRRLARGPVRVVVFYDGVHPDGSSAPGGLEVRFSGADGSADEDILESVPQFPPPVVVVSDDREVREGSERHGALGLWSTALAAWIRSR